MHDPLCPSVVKNMLAAGDCVFCQLIAKVRREDRTDPKDNRP